MNDNFHRVPPVIERDTFKRLFTPLFDANGNVTGMSRPYFFEHNSFGLDVHAEFPEPLLYQKYSSAIRKRSTKDSVALVARWNLRPFTFGEGTYDDWGFHTPAITTAESMPDRTFNYLDKVFAEVTGGAVRVPYAFTAPKELKQVNDLLSRIKAMKPHDDVVDQNMMRWSQSRAFQDVTLTDDWNDGFIEPANRQGWLFSGKATRPSSAKHGMPPERRSYG